MRASSRGVPEPPRRGARRSARCPIGGPAHIHNGRGQIRVEPDRLAEKAERDLVLLRCVFVEVPEAALVSLPGIETFRRLAQHALLLGLSQRGFDGAPKVSHLIASV